MSNRALASEIGMTEATIAGRIRALTDRNVLGVTAMLDWRAAGYRWDAWLEVQVTGRPLRVVGDEIASLDGVHAVYAVFGPADLQVHLLLADGADAVELLSERISNVQGVWSVRPNITLETLKYTTSFARLPVPPQELHFPDPVVEIDSLDRQLIQSLVADGRQSNRQIARNFDVSEGTVRIRLRRLEQEGLLRIVGQSDPVLTGAAHAWAFVGIDVDPGAARAVARSLCDMNEVLIVAIVAGRHDVLALVSTSSRSRLVELIVDEVRMSPGVRSTETWQVVQTLGGDNQRWARLF